MLCCTGTNIIIYMCTSTLHVWRNSMNLCKYVKMVLLLEKTVFTECRLIYKVHILITIFGPRICIQGEDELWMYVLFSQEYHHNMRCFTGLLPYTSLKQQFIKVLKWRNRHGNFLCPHKYFFRELQTCSFWVPESRATIHPNAFIDYFISHAACTRLTYEYCVVLAVASSKKFDCSKKKVLLRAMTLERRIQKKLRDVKYHHLFHSMRLIPTLLSIEASLWLEARYSIYHNLLDNDIKLFVLALLIVP